MHHWPTISSFPYLYIIHLSWYQHPSTLLAPLNMVLMEVDTQTEGAPGFCCLCEYRKMIQKPPKINRVCPVLQPGGMKERYLCR